MENIREIKCSKCGAKIQIEDYIEKEIQIEFENKKNNIEKELRAKIEDEQKEARKVLENEISEKTEKLKEYNKTKAELERVYREKEELKETIELEMQKNFNQKFIEEKQKLKNTIKEEYELTIQEWKTKYEEQIKLTEEMKKKQEQGSMQLQGEVQEILIEQYLKNSFKYDSIEEVKKGDMGADCLQYVYTSNNRECGIIYYESKRTKTFNEEWIKKFKSDMLEKNAEIGVLVTAVYPKDMDRMGTKDGIYICSFDEFKGLSFILRESLIKISSINLTNCNKNEKMERIYEYLTSQEFKSQIEGVANAFTSMKMELENEKAAMTKIWKKREKDLENVLRCIMGMGGSIQSITENEVILESSELLSIADENKN